MRMSWLPVVSTVEARLVAAFATAGHGDGVSPCRASGAAAGTPAISGVMRRMRGHQYP